MWVHHRATPTEKSVASKALLQQQDDDTSKRSVLQISWSNIYDVGRYVHLRCVYVSNLCALNHNQKALQSNLFFAWFE